MSNTKTITASWWKAAFRLWLILFASVTLIYALGGQGFRSTRTGASASFNREQDVSLLRINDSVAYSVHFADPNSRPSLVRYQEGSLPFSPLLGRYTSDGEIVPGSTHQQGDWVYSASPQYGPTTNIDIYNLRTGEAIRVNGVKEPADYQPLDLRTVPEYARRGLLGADAYQIPAARVLAQRYPEELSVPKESAIVFSGGFILVGFLLLLIWPFSRQKVLVGQPGA